MDVPLPQDRRAARVLLVDDASQVLLLVGGDPGEPSRGTWWFTPGGGLEAAESPVQAATRELAEETGLQVAPSDLGAVVHQRVTHFRFRGADYRQSEDYFLLRVTSYEVDLTGPDTVVDPGVTGHRWWSIPDLRNTTETVFPAELADVLDRVLA